MAERVSRRAGRGCRDGGAAGPRGELPMPGRRGKLPMPGRRELEKGSSTYMISRSRNRVPACPAARAGSAAPTARAKTHTGPALEPGHTCASHVHWKIICCDRARKSLRLYQPADSGSCRTAAAGSAPRCPPGPVHWQAGRAYRDRLRRGRGPSLLVT